MLYTSSFSNISDHSSMPATSQKPKSRQSECADSKREADRENTSTNLTPGKSNCNRSPRRSCAKTTKCPPIFTFHLLIIIFCLTISVAMSERCGLSRAMCSCMAQGWGYRTCAQQHFKKRSGAAVAEPEHPGVYKQRLQNALKEKNILHKRHAELPSQLLQNGLDIQSKLSSKRAFMKTLLNPN